MSDNEKIKRLIKVLYQTRCELKKIKDRHIPIYEIREIAEELIYWLEDTLKKIENDKEGINEDIIQSNSR